MALIGRIFGKAKRRGVAGPARQVPAEADAIWTAPVFASGDTAGFWAWFSDNAQLAAKLNRSLQQGGGDPEKLVRPLFDGLQCYHDGLSLLVGLTETGQNELVISADGVVANFPAVTRLVAAAPAPPNWKITAFKPRMQASTQVTINGQTIDADMATYMAEIDRARGLLNIAVTLPWLGNIPEGAQTQIALLLLDNLLGEFDVATAIGHIDVDMRARGETARGKSLTGLPRDVDALSARGARH